MANNSDSPFQVITVQFIETAEVFDYYRLFDLSIFEKSISERIWYFYSKFNGSGLISIYDIKCDPAPNSPEERVDDKYKSLSVY